MEIGWQDVRHFVYFHLWQRHPSLPTNNQSKSIFSHAVTNYTEYWFYNCLGCMMCVGNKIPVLSAVAVRQSQNLVARFLTNYLSDFYFGVKSLQSINHLLWREDDDFTTRRTMWEFPDDSAVFITPKLILKRINQEFGSAAQKFYVLGLIWDMTADYD